MKPGKGAGNHVRLCCLTVNALSPCFSTTADCLPLTLSQNELILLYFYVRHCLGMRKGSNRQGQARGSGVVEAATSPCHLPGDLGVGTSRQLCAVPSHIRRDGDISYPAKQLEETQSTGFKGGGTPETCHQPAMLLLRVPRKECRGKVPWASGSI